MSVRSLLRWSSVGGAGGDPYGEGGAGGEGGKPGGEGGDDGDGGLYGSSGEGDSDSGGVAGGSGFCCAPAGPMPSSIATARAPSITHRTHQVLYVKEQCEWSPSLSTLQRKSEVCTLLQSFKGRYSRT